MNILTLLVFVLFILLSPWALMPRARRRPEIHGALNVLWGLNALYCALWHRLEAERTAPLPESGAAILVSNHTSGIDPMILQASCRRVLGFLIAKEFYEYWLFHPICRLIGCIPVRRDGHDLAATRAALRALEEGRVVPVFPEGRIIPTSGRELGEGKPGVAFLVLHARVPVIPAYIWGTPATNVVWRGILTPSLAHVIYGSPIDFSDLSPDRSTDREALADVTDRLMGAIRALRESVRMQEVASGARLPGRPEFRLETPCEPRRTESRAGAVPGDRTAVRST